MKLTVGVTVFKELLFTFVLLVDRSVLAMVFLMT